MTHTKDEALISLIMELVGIVALHDMEKARRLGIRVHQALAAPPVQEPKQSPPFTFRRFVAGCERAQDVAVHREITLDAAIRVAAKICPPSESGHPTVLVYTPLAGQPAVPDAITDSDENPKYRAGWNECRETMLEMMKARTL